MQLFKRGLTIAVIASLVGGCTLQEECMVVDLIVPDQYHIPDHFDGKRTNFDTWWNGFADDHLKKLIDFAMEHSHDYEAAKERLREICFEHGASEEEADAQIKNPHIEFFPKYGDKSGSTEIDKGRGSFTDGNSIPKDSYMRDKWNIRLLSASFELDFFGKKKHGVHAAMHEIMTAGELLNEVRASIASKITQRYIDLRQHQTNEIHMSKYIDTHKKYVVLMNERAKAGINSEDEVENAEDQLASMRLTQFKSTTHVQKAFHDISRLSGVSDMEEIKGMLGHQCQVPYVDPNVLAGTPSNMIKNRPDIKAKLRMLKKVCSLIGLSLADQFPTFLFHGSLEMAVKAIDKILSLSSLDYAYGVSVNHNIYQRWKINSKIKVFRSKYKQAKTDYHKTVNHALAEVSDAMSHVLYATHTLTYYEKIEKELENKCKKSQEKLKYDGKELPQTLKLNHKYAMADHDRFSDIANMSKSVVHLIRALGWSHDGSAEQNSDTDTKQISDEGTGDLKKSGT